MKSTPEDLHRKKIEKETHEILLLGQANNKLLRDALDHAQRGEKNAIEALKKASDAEAAAVRAQLASERSEQQCMFCRAEIRDVNGRLDRVDELLQRLVTANENLERALRKRDKLQGGNAAATEDAAARSTERSGAP